MGAEVTNLKLSGNKSQDYTEIKMVSFWFTFKVHKVKKPNIYVKGYFFQGAFFVIFAHPTAVSS